VNFPVAAFEQPRSATAARRFPGADYSRSSMVIKADTNPAQPVFAARAELVSTALTQQTLVRVEIEHRGRPLALHRIQFLQGDDVGNCEDGHQDGQWEKNTSRHGIIVP
jgi:hypothetical protein